MAEDLQLNEIEVKLSGEVSAAVILSFFLENIFVCATEYMSVFLASVMYDFTVLKLFSQGTFCF